MLISSFTSVGSSDALESVWTRGLKELFVEFWEILQVSCLNNHKELNLITRLNNKTKIIIGISHFLIILLHFTMIYAFRLLTSIVSVHGNTVISCATICLFSTLCSNVKFVVWNQLLWLADIIELLPCWLSKFEEVIDKILIIRLKLKSMLYL